MNGNMIKFASINAALQHADASRQGEAILLQGAPAVVSQAYADRLASAGVEFAYLIDHEMPDGSRRVVTVPVN